MKNVLIILISVLLLFVENGFAKEEVYCQQDNACTTCESEDADCLVINGKRLDSGESRGSRTAPPANSELQLKQSNSPQAFSSKENETPSLKSCEDVLKEAPTTASQPFRISVDGVPLKNHSGAIDPDLQRCTDLALQKADIQIRYDSLEKEPVLNVSATPNGAVRHGKVTFTAYSSYDFWIKKRELRVFPAQASTQSVPIAILPFDQKGQVVWRPDNSVPAKITYVLRVYDEKGRFDETRAKPLFIDHRAKPLKNQGTGPREELIGYGENSLKVHNIPLRGGTITVNGTEIAPSSQVIVMGQIIPVSANGRFVIRQILPAGDHVVEVQVVDHDSELNFARNLYIPNQDWFYIGLVDLTTGKNNTSGPAELVTGDTQHYDNDVYVDGRLAFYLKGKIKGEYLLTAAADTQEQPFEDLFSNFDSKDPRYLLRRLDPDLYYPVYGDDSTTIEDAPTRGKFYVKLARGNSHVMWGNFQTRWTGSDFVNFNRGMYGANIYYEAPTQTSYGEKHAKVDLFAGDPGTLGARDDFRGTGGSLYYLRHLDITQGSEKVWVEIRDKDSGIVLQTNQLTAGQDYEINSIQGRLLLTSPLPSTADDSELVRSGSLSGNPVFLIATYEYVPGLAEVDNMTLGGRASTWFGDHVNVGVSGYKEGDDDSEQKLAEVDITLRYDAGTYIKGELAHSNGPGYGNNNSLTGGFEFNTVTAVDAEAQARRVEAAVNFAEIGMGEGQANIYWQSRERGFSGPGQIASEDIDQFGAAITKDITETISFETKADVKDSESQDTVAASVYGHYQLTPQWKLSAGVRYDDLDNNSANSSSTLSQNGSRTDVAGQIGYSPFSSDDDPDWSIYGFIQGTVDTTETRTDNDRIGLGGDYKIIDPLRLNGEISGGDGGLGGKVGADWRVNERSQLYMNYAVDTDRTDDRFRGRQGNFTTGGKTRYSESMAIYAEERLQHGDGPSGLIHSFGLDLAALDTWYFGFNAENGNLSDPEAEDLERTALSFSAGYAKEKSKYAGNLEWRLDDGETSGERTTWLMRNSVGYQTTPDWRFLGKFNFSVSDSEVDDSLNADFVEAVIGYAYRPVENDRFNALFKYTFFYDLPTASALTASETMADYAQRSHILSADATYDLTAWMSIGGKYGFRRGEIKDNRIDDGPWFRSDAHLAIVRTDWHFVHKWDALLEARWLHVVAAEDERAGFLAAIYRHMGENLKLGVGYNFTDFSDDLTDQDYDSKGWFVKLTGKF